MTSNPKQQPDPNPQPKTTQRKSPDPIPVKPEQKGNPEFSQPPDRAEFNR